MSADMIPQVVPVGVACTDGARDALDDGTCGAAGLGHALVHHIGQKDDRRRMEVYRMGGVDSSSMVDD